jgi:hypothetical protein
MIRLRRFHLRPFAASARQVRVDRFHLRPFAASARQVRGGRFHLRPFRVGRFHLRPFAAVARPAVAVARHALATMAAMMIGGGASLLACPMCFGAEETPLIDGAKLGVLVMLGVLFAVQGGFVAFFPICASGRNRTLTSSSTWNGRSFNEGLEHHD